MKIVRKNKPGQPLRREGYAVADDERLLNQWYDSLSYGPQTHIRTSALDRHVARILRTLRDRQLWIACECQSEQQSSSNQSSSETQLSLGERPTECKQLPVSDSNPLSDAPILCPIKLDSWGHRYSFRRIRPQQRHHPTCIFHTQIPLEEQFVFEQESPEGAEERGANGGWAGDLAEGRHVEKLSGLQPLSGAASFAIDVREPDSAQLVLASPPSRRSPHRRSRSDSSRPKLARMLFTLLEEAQLHIVRPGWWRNHSAVRQLQSLQRTKRNIVNRVPLKHYLTTQPAAIPDGCRKLVALVQAKANDWPPHVKPQAFFAGIATHIDCQRRTIQAAGYSDPLMLEEELTCFVAPSGQPSGPFWVFAHIGESVADSSRYRLRQAYVHPVFNTGLLVPVDSHAERLTLDILLVAQRQLQERGYSFAIAKPLHDCRTEAGQPYRPDFVLYPYRRGKSMQAGDCVVVETMGFADREYIDRKTRTHQRMLALGPVLAWEIRGSISETERQAYLDDVLRACELLMKTVRRKR